MKNRRAGNIVRMSLSFLAFVGSLVGAPAAGRELTNPLTAEEVACNELQLERLLHRMNAAKGGEYHPPELPNTLLVSYSNASGFYDGLVATTENVRLDVGQIPPDEFYEQYLAFNVNPSIRTLRLNPRQPELAQVSLNREQSSSSLVPPGSWFAVVLTLDPTLGRGERLTINNLVEPPAGSPYNGFLANSTKPGRGLTVDDLLTPCHNKLTEFDRHVFSILQRVARSSDLSQFLQPDTEIAIFRGEDPHVYRLNFYPIYEFLEARGRMSVELRIDWDENGRLTSAVASTYQLCSTEGHTGCTNLRERSLRWFLIPPVFGGREYYNNDKVQNGGAFRWTQGPDAPVTVDLQALLTNTAWNRPSW